MSRTPTRRELRAARERVSLIRGRLLQATRQLAKELDEAEDELARMERARRI